MAQGVVVDGQFAVYRGTVCHAVADAGTGLQTQVLQGISLHAGGGVIPLSVVLNTGKSGEVGAGVQLVGVGGTGIELHAILGPISPEFVLFGGGVTHSGTPIESQGALLAYIPGTGATVKGGMPAVLIYARGCAG